MWMLTLKDRLPFTSHTLSIASSCFWVPWLFFPLYYFSYFCFTLVGTIASTLSQLVRASQNTQAFRSISGLDFLGAWKRSPRGGNLHKAVSMNTESRSFRTWQAQHFATIVVGLIAWYTRSRLKRLFYYIDFGFFLLAAMVVLLQLLRSAPSIWTSLWCASFICHMF